MKTEIFILFIFACGALCAENSAPADTVSVQGKKMIVQVNGNDTVYMSYLRDIYIFPQRLLYKNKKEEKFFWKTVRDVKRTLPYARLVARELNMVNSKLETLHTKKEQKKFINQYQKEIFAKYEKDLRRMTVSQGRMLIKLIDRECNKSSYELIKMYKGGFTAFFWQGIAGLFGSKLKSEYDVTSSDAVVERIILLVEAGQI